MRVAVADDGPLFRQGLVALLEDANIDVCGVAANGLEIVEIAKVALPDAVILDIKMPPGEVGGLDAAREIRMSDPEMAILFLSNTASTHYLMQALDLGAERMGYRIKDHVTSVATLSGILTRLTEGHVEIEPAIASRLVSRKRTDDDRTLDRLTPRELNVLRLMAEGHSNRSIESSLQVGAGAIEKHISSIFSKLELPPDATSYDRRVKAVLAYLRVNSTGDPST